MDNYMPTNLTTKNGQFSRNIKTKSKNKSPKLNQEIDNMNRPMTRTEIKSIKKQTKLPTNKGPGPDGFTGKFAGKHAKENLYQFFLFLKIEEGTPKDIL